MVYAMTGSWNMQVHSLVNPSLFPLVKSLSRSIVGSSPPDQPRTIDPQFESWKTFMGAGQVVEELPAVDGVFGVFTSERFQWLPSDVTIDSDGCVKLLSYINNMHPEWHSQLYDATVTLLERSVPLLERVMASAAAEKHRAITPPEHYENGVCFGTLNLSATCMNLFPYGRAFIRTHFLLLL